MPASDGATAGGDDRIAAARMHRYGPEAEALARDVFGYAVERLGREPRLGTTLTEAELGRRAGGTVTEDGIGTAEAMRVFREVLEPACVDPGHPRFLSFVPNVPSTSATLFDLAVSASRIFADWWMEGSGAIHAENEALRWIAGLLGWGPEAGGVFVSGGTAANLSALAVGREARGHRAAGDHRRAAVAFGEGGHSSLRLAARVLDLEVVEVPTDDRGRMRGPALDAALESSELHPCVVAATAGTTNLGVIDDLAGVAEVCERRGVWLHVDGAYGGAALAVESVRERFAGVERADSFVVDPHKWLFAPLDCAALLYRDPAQARATFTQRAEYIDSIEARGEWNPSDYAVHLTRRARGLPFWFGLASHGWRAYAEAIEHGLTLAREAAELIDGEPHVELLFEPELSVVLFRRPGWEPDDYERWSERAHADGLTLTAPTSWHGETLLRFCFVNPTTTLDDVRAIIASLK